MQLPSHKAVLYIVFVLSLFLAGVMVACAPPAGEATSANPSVSAAGDTAEISTEPNSEADPDSAAGDEVDQATGASSGTEASTASEVEPAPVDPEQLWMQAAHADTYVLDESGHNSACARCHAPVQWVPAMDDMPASCSSCKFEVEDPPPLIPEAEWTGVECKVCHEVNRRGQVQAEIAWLEIAAIEEYADVEAPGELCTHCHVTGGVDGHVSVAVGGVQANYGCTECHDAHETTATCSGADCHAGADPAAAIAGHDEAHAQVTCAACHDASGADVGITESGEWVTLLPVPEGESKPFTSHNIQLAVDCARCHYEGNAWGLTTDLEP